MDLSRIVHGKTSTTCKSIGPAVPVQYSDAKVDDANQVTKLNKKLDPTYYDHYRIYSTTNSFIYRFFCFLKIKFTSLLFLDNLVSNQSKVRCLFKIIVTPKTNELRILFISQSVSIVVHYQFLFFSKSLVSLQYVSSSQRHHQTIVVQ